MVTGICGLNEINDNSYKSFENIYLNALNTQAPSKTKILRFSNSAFMAEKLRRLKLENDFNKKKNHENLCKYKTQRNRCENPLRKSKVQYFNNISDSNVTDNKSFWKSVLLCFSNKGSNSNKIPLVENDTNITRQSNF